MPPPASSKDEELLRHLGYEQKLNRSWSVLQNFGVSFSIISVITGITTLFSTGLTNGGPGVMSNGWIIVCFFTMFVAISMAQITSAIPTSGGPYYWAAALAPRKHSAFVSWVTGWFNFLGQVAVTTGITFGCAGLITTLITVGSPNFEVTAAKTLGIYAALLTSHALVNCFMVRWLRWLNNLSILLHSVGVSCLCISLLAKAPKLQSAKFVFATFYDGTGGWSIRASPAYVACIGILLAQYTITGFDASAHLAEETANAATAAPIGVIMSVGVSALFGFFLLVAYLFCIQDFQATLNNPYGQPVLQIMIDCVGTTGAKALMSLVIVCIWHCGLFSLTSNSRMMYAFARDRALPPFFDDVSTKWQAPIKTICLAAILSFCLALPSLGSTVAFSASTSIATIGLYISYGLPILIGLMYEKDFEKGPFNLRGFSRPCAFLAVCWIVFITVVFCLPTVNPVNDQTLNYTVVAVGIVALYAFGSWFLWARKWFTGPINQVEAELEREGVVGGNHEVVEEVRAHHLIASDKGLERELTGKTVSV